MVVCKHWLMVQEKEDLNSKTIMAMNKVKINSDVELKDRLVAINRVTKVTKGGRTFTFAAIVVVGDGNGVVGWGLGKAGEVTTAISKGVESAKKNLVKATISALSEMRDAYTVAGERGISMDKVFNG